MDPVPSFLILSILFIFLKSCIEKTNHTFLIETADNIPLFIEGNIKDFTKLVSNSQLFPKSPSGCKEDSDQSSFQTDWSYSGTIGT